MTSIRTPKFTDTKPTTDLTTLVVDSSKPLLQLNKHFEQAFKDIKAVAVPDTSTRIVMVTQKDIPELIILEIPILANIPKVIANRINKFTFYELVNNTLTLKCNKYSPVMFSNLIFNLMNTLQSESFSFDKEKFIKLVNKLLVNDITALEDMRWHQPNLFKELTKDLFVVSHSWDDVDVDMLMSNSRGSFVKMSNGQYRVHIQSLNNCELSIIGTFAIVDGQLTRADAEEGHHYRSKRQYTYFELEKMRTYLVMNKVAFMDLPWVDEVPVVQPATRQELKLGIAELALTCNKVILEDAGAGDGYVIPTEQLTEAMGKLMEFINKGKV